jgi:hypothetical protein
MRYGKRLTILLLFLAVACSHTQTAPKLTEEQERDIRAAQVAALVAQQNVVNSDIYQAAQDATKKLNGMIDDAYVKDGADKSKFKLQEQNGRLAFVEIPQRPATPPPTKK